MSNRIQMVAIFLGVFWFTILQANAGKIAYTKGSGQNLRNKPYRGVICTYRTGDKIEILWRHYRTNWYFVKTKSSRTCRGYQGYLHNSVFTYAKPSAADNDNTSKKSSKKLERGEAAYAVGTDRFLRMNPNDDTICELNSGDKVKIRWREGSWIFVDAVSSRSCSGKSGYAHTSILSSTPAAGEEDSDEDTSAASDSEAGSNEVIENEHIDEEHAQEMDSHEDHAHDESTQDDIETPEALRDASQVGRGATVYATGEERFLRMNPNDDEICELNLGDKMKIRWREGSWLFVDVSSSSTCSGKSGYAHKSILSKTKYQAPPSHKTDEEADRNKEEREREQVAQAETEAEAEAREETPNYIQKQFVQGTNVQLRTEPNTSARVRCKLDMPAVVWVAKSDSDWLPVKTDDNIEGCAGEEGFIYKSLIAEEKAELTYRTLYIDGSNVSVRNEPSTDSRRICFLNTGNRVAAGEERGDWVPVKIDDKLDQCPVKDGWIHSSLLSKKKVEVDSNLNILQELKFLRGVTKVPPKEFTLPRNTDRGRRSRRGDSRRSKDLVRVPKIRGAWKQSVCGSHHYNPMSRWNDAYIHINAACAFVGMLQDWARDECRNSGSRACRIAWGDISRGDRASFPPHSTHRDGYCVDFRLIKKTWGDYGMTWRAGNYDRDKTLDFLRHLRAHGASYILFNDPVARRKGLSSYSGGHDNHIHACFKNHSRTRSKCSSLTIDKGLCPHIAKGNIE